MRYANARCTYEEVYQPRHGYVFTGPCFGEPNQTHSVFVPAEELFAYNQGELIQDAMPSVSAEDREFLISGISPKKWNEMHKVFEEEDNDPLNELADLAKIVGPEEVERICRETVDEFFPPEEEG